MCFYGSKEKYFNQNKKNKGSISARVSIYLRDSVSVTQQDICSALHPDSMQLGVAGTWV
jgi:hypothetical protein